DKHFNAEAKAIIAEWEAGKFDGYPSEVTDEFRRLTAAKEGKDEKAVKGLDDKIKDLAKNQTSILREAKDMLVKWEARDPQVYLLWTTMNNWVYQGFDVTYKAMGVDFDKLYYESDTFLLGKDIVLEGLQKEIFYRKDDGSVWIDLTSEGLDEKLVLRSDGTAVYMTQDIGTAVDRFKDYPDLSSIIYTVGNEQDYHFKVLFLILEKMGYDWAKDCAHLSYGMVDLPTGKMKSREGTVVDADDLMAEVVESATEMTRERGHLDGMSESDKEHLFELIGMGGLKYYLLKVDPKKRMMFNPEESIELNGNTGPFIQYAHARIKSLLAKSGIAELNSSNCTSLQAEEKEIIKLLTEFPVIIEEAANEQSPALVANYTYELVKAYNHFYQVVPILIEPDTEVKHLRLLLSTNVAKVIRLSMRLLGIEVPERM
ncbi:MAG: arginine--tRNA ligase, partial [Flavobacteriia bacterium]